MLQAQGATSPTPAMWKEGGSVAQIPGELSANTARSAPRLAQEACDRLYEFNRLMIWQTEAVPSDIAESLAQLAALVAALPQAFNQLAHCLHLAEARQLLSMDSMLLDPDPATAVGVARLELQEAKELAVDLYRLLNAAHNSTAHVGSAGLGGKGNQ